MATYSTKDMVKQRYMDPDRVVNAMRWLEAILNKSYDVTDDDIKDENFEKFLGRRKIGSSAPPEIVGIRDGYDLCCAVNVIKPGTIKRVKPKTAPLVPFQCTSQISTATTKMKDWIKEFKLKTAGADICDAQDLYSHNDLPKVMDTIYALDKLSHFYSDYNGPHIQGNKPYKQANKRVFSAETLAKSKSAVPKMAKGGIYQKTSNQDGYGIVKTDKSMQNPSQVQSVWAKGAKKVDNKNMDGYGIVKTDKSMQNPSQVQGAWQKGSYKVDNKGMDGYGIVKTDKSMQNPSQVQGVWAQGAKKVENNNMDGYGIVKTDKSMQNPSQVQGVWAQGAKKVDNKGMDGYGIVKVDENMQNPSQVQGVWQQGAKKNENAGMDGYGVVKVDESMQNPSQVQGAWQQGANANENNNMDSYGVVKQSQD